LRTRLFLARRTVAARDRGFAADLGTRLRYSLLRTAAQPTVFRETFN
jgi:hypothetical protein